MHTVIDFRTQDEHQQREDTALEFTVDEEMALRIRMNTRAWRQKNGYETTDAEAA
jgi:hypothetical protein